MLTADAGRSALGAAVSGTWAADFDVSKLDNEHNSTVVDRVPAVRIRSGQPYQALLDLPQSFANFFARPVETSALGSASLTAMGRTAARLTLSTVVLVIVGCNDGYSAEPTFCDEWCAALRHPSDCAEGPASCVRDCELTRASDDCFPIQEQLLGCYQQLEPAAFSCAPEGAQSTFGDRQRVDKAACRAERDALFECEAPGFGECLGICRGYQTLVTQGALGEDVQIVPSDECPLLTQPCETICWTAFLFTSDDLERLRLPTLDAPGAPSSTSREPAPDGGTDAGGAPTDPISELFEPCFQIGGLTEPPP